MAKRKNWKKRRKRILRRKIMRAVVLLCMLLVLVGAIMLVTMGIKKLVGLVGGEEKPASSNKIEQVEKDKTDEEDGTDADKEDDAETLLVSNTPQKLTREQSIAQITAMAEKHSEMKKVLERQAEYPDEILLMLANNPETLTFVQNYPEKKGTVMNADALTELKSGEIPLLLQWDDRWGYAPYGDYNIAISGCGPTALAMVASGLCQNAGITPYTVANYAQEQGYYSEAGTSWDLMTSGCEQFGIRGEELSLSESSIQKALEAGRPIICTMGAGAFTTEGHYIVLTEWKDGMIKLHDPNSISRSNKLWSYSELEGQIKNLWGYSVK